MNTETKPAFRPHNSTGGEITDLFYRESLTGPNGMHFELFKELHHTKKDVDNAKAYLRKNRDVASITIVSEKDFTLYN